jgi:GDP-L-fucose synthase
MNKNSIIYIAGHGGLIGQALTVELRKQGYKRLLLKTHDELDLTCRKKVEIFFKKQKLEYVFLTAGKVGGIKANTESPADFIYENTQISANVIEVTSKYRVKKLLFLGCGCMYPKICPQPIKEEYLLTGPLEPTNESYALAKIFGVKMCQAYNKQYGTNFIIPVAANVYGPFDHFDDSGHVIASLIKRFHEAKVSGKKELTIWGRGTAIRDFIYAGDVAKACIFLMKNYNSSDIINIGTGQATSITELADIIKEVVGFKGRILYDRTKPDGMPQRLLDIRKIKSLGWHAETKLKDGIARTYNWFKKI